MFMRVPLVPVLDSAAEVDASSFSLSDPVNRFLSFRNRLDEHFEAQVCRASRSAERFSKNKRTVDPVKSGPLLLYVFTMVVLLFSRILLVLSFQRRFQSLTCQSLSPSTLLLIRVPSSLLKESSIVVSLKANSFILPSDLAMILRQLLGSLLIRSLTLQ